MTDKELELKKEFAEVLRSGITFAGQIGDYVIDKSVFDWFFSKIQEKDSQLRAKEDQLKAAKEVVDQFEELKKAFEEAGQLMMSPKGIKMMNAALETYKKLNP